MGTTPVKRLLIQMSWPVMLSMLVQALYNLVDSIFVSYVSDTAFLALSYAFPIQSLMIAICVGTGAGVNAILSRRLGEKRHEDANAVALNGYFIYLLLSFLFLLFGLTLSRPFFSFFTEDPHVRQYGTQYVSIVTACSIGMCMQFASERVLQATGHPVGNMMVQGIGVIFNLIFDPLLIFGLGPFPELGVRGAAIATVGGQILGALVGLFLVRRVKELRLHVRGFRPCARTILDIYGIGLPATITQTLVTIMITVLNKIFGTYSEIKVFILGDYFKLQAFVYMPIFGLTTGLVPVAGYNYGARNQKRISEAVRFTLTIAVCIMLVGTLSFQLFPDKFMSMFNPPPETLAAGIPALRIISISFPIAAITIVFTSTFQALGSPLLSLLVSVTRQLIVIIPVAWVICLFNPSQAWWAFPIADVSAATLSLLLYRKTYRDKLLPLMEPSNP